MCVLNVEIPNSLSSTIDSAYLKKLAAVDLYNKGNVSIGLCAELAGMNLLEFIQYLGQNKIPLYKYDSYEDFLKEVDNANHCC